MQTEDKKTQENQHLEMPVYELDKIKVQPFDEITVGYLKTMQEQNNVYVGLRTQDYNSGLKQMLCRDLV